MSNSRKIARLFVYGNKKQNKVLYLGLCALCFFSIVILTFQESLLQYRQEENYKMYGEWSGAIYNGNPEIYDFLKSSEDVKKIGKIDVFENVSVFQTSDLGYVGVIDQKAFELAKINMVQGKLPDEKDEIVLDKYLLEEIAPTAKVGDTITVSIVGSEHEETEKYQFSLSGIIEPWNEKWDKSSYKLPVAFVNEGCDFSEKFWKKTHYFFLGDEKADYVIRNLDELLKKHTDSIYIYNEKSYAPVLSVVDEYFEQGTFLAMISVIDGLVIFFLLSMVSTKMKFRVNVIRNIGCDYKTIFRIFMWETFYIWRKGIAEGLCIGLLIVGSAIIVIRNLFNLSFPIVFNIEDTMLSILLLTIIFLFGYLVIGLNAVRQRMQTSFREDNSSVAKRELPLVKKIKPMNAFRLYVRNLKIYPERNVLRVVVSIVSVVILNIYVVQFLDYYHRYQKTDISYDYNLTILDMEKSLCNAEIERIMEIPGITSIEVEKIVFPYYDTISISWDGWENSNYINGLRKHGFGSSLENKKRRYSDSYDVPSIKGVSENNPELVNWYRSCLDEGELDVHKFWDGEQCVLLLSPYALQQSEMENQNYQIMPIINQEEYNKVSKIYEYENNEYSLKPGNEITVEIEGVTEEIEVGGIIRRVTGWPPEGLQGAIGSGEIIVSEKFIDKIVGTSEDEYNYLNIQSYANADHTKTTWKLTNEIENFMSGVKEGAYTFENKRESASMIKKWAMTGMVQTGFMIIITLLLLGFILFQGTLGKLQNETKHISILHFLGMSKQKIKSIYWIEGVLEGIVSGILGMIAAGSIQYFIWKKESGYTTFKAIIEAGLNENPMNEHFFEIYMANLLLFFVIYLLLVTLPIHNMLKKQWNGKSNTNRH